MNQSSLAMLAFACSVSCGGAFGQTPVFDAASVRVPADTRARSSMRGGPGTSDPGQITFTNVTLWNVLLRAYDLKQYQLAGPGWLTARKYQIAATIPAGTTKEQFNLMLRNLLIERFQIQMHHETKEIQGYELAQGKSAPKLRVAKPSEAAAALPEPGTPPKTDANGFPQLDHRGLVMMEGVKGKSVVSYLTAKEQPLSALVDLLSKEFRLPITDKTGLSGEFDFTLEFAPQPPGALPSAAMEGDLPAAVDDSAPNLMTAVQQQLGLRLVPRKLPVDVLVIDRGNPVPSEN